MGDTPDRQVARDAQVIGRDALHARAGERDLRKAVGDEVVRAQIVVTPVIAGRDTGRLDVRGDTRRVRLAGIVAQVGGPLPEGAVHPRNAEVPDAERDRAVRGVRRPAIGGCRRWRRCSLLRRLPGQRERSWREQSEDNDGSSHASR